MKEGRSPGDHGPTQWHTEAPRDHTHFIVASDSSMVESEGDNLWIIIYTLVVGCPIQLPGKNDTEKAEGVKQEREGRGSKKLCMHALVHAWMCT